MYGYDAYGYDPATEGIKDAVGGFFAMVWKKIVEFKDFLKDLMHKIGAWIKKVTNTQSADVVNAASSEAVDLVEKIGVDIRAILSTCSDEIDVLYKKWSKVGAYKTISNEDYDKLDDDKKAYIDANGTSTTRVYMGSTTNPGKERLDYDAALRAKGGMDKISSDAKHNSNRMSEWNDTIEELGKHFAKQAGAATQVSANIKKLTSYGNLTLSATKRAYDKLRDIFNANGEFGAAWKKVKIAAEWSTGEIRKALNKVVSMYDVGVRATTSFGNRLASGKFRGDDGEKMSRADKSDTMAEYKLANSAFKHNKSRSNIDVSRKDKNFHAMRTASGPAPESIGIDVLGRLYQMAYEDAMEDIEASAIAIENYDAVPGYYTFADEYEPTYDPDYDLY